MHTKKVLTLFWPDGTLLTAKKLKIHTLQCVPFIITYAAIVRATADLSTVSFTPLSNSSVTVVSSTV